MKIESVKTPEQLYRLISLDFTSPAFVSFEASYYGTADAILSVLQALGRPDMLAAAEVYFKNNHDGDIKVLHRDVTFLEPVDLIAVRHYDRGAGQYVFKNVWDCDYLFRYDGVSEEHFYLRTKACEYIRCIRLRFTNLQVQSKLRADVWRTPRLFWGHPGIIIKQDGIIENRLYVLDNHFKTEAELQEALNDPRPCSYDPFFAEIIGDG